MPSKNKIFVYFEKNHKKRLTSLTLCDKIVNCIIIACTMETDTPKGVSGASNRDLFVHSDKRNSNIPYGVRIAAFEALSAVMVGREIHITEF